MADQKVSALQSVGAVTGDELIHLVVNGNSRKATLNTLLNAMAGVTVPSAVVSSYRGCVARPGTPTIDNSGFSTPQWLTWLTSDVNWNNIWTYGSPTRLTVQAGTTKVNVRVSIPQAAAAISGEIMIYKNGVKIASNTGKTVETSVLNVTAGDYFEAVTSKYTSFKGSGEPQSDYYFEMVVVEASP